MIIENGAGDLTAGGLEAVNNTIIILKDLRQKAGSISLSGIFSPQPSNYYNILGQAPGWTDFFRTQSGVINVIDTYIRDLPTAVTDADASVMIQGITEYANTWKNYTIPRLAEIKEGIKTWVNANYAILNGTLVKKESQQAPTSQVSAIQQDVAPISTSGVTIGPIQVPQQKNTPLIVAAVAAGLYFLFNR